MARTTAPLNTLLINSNLADPTGVACASGAGNGVQVPANTGGPAYPEQLLLRVANASGGAGNLVVLAGAQPLAIASGQGALTVSVPNSSTMWFGPFESGRFEQNDGSIIAESSVALTVTAFRVPRH